ncbi:hypothetical protein Nepgr_026569 [Nepenthes gracilis]|uniref:Uncharacterized protein n=1 Tax=Nepenthes gracilis TaxID=150966 RepID=A0AAD3TA01_NEPGR|nr:hypothetical protein Nepgr_026569 [Nepenthes gracilis]
MLFQGPSRQQGLLRSVLILPETKEEILKIKVLLSRPPVLDNIGVMWNRWVGSSEPVNNGARATGGGPVSLNRYNQGGPWESHVMINFGAFRSTLSAYCFWDVSYF